MGRSLARHADHAVAMQNRAVSRSHMGYGFSALCRAFAALVAAWIAGLHAIMRAGECISLGRDLAQSSESLDRACNRAWSIRDCFAVSVGWIQGDFCFY